MNKAWTTFSEEDLRQSLQCDLVQGLDDVDAIRRLRQYGPNQLAEH